MNCGEKYTSHMGKYPVINLSLKSGKQPTFKMAHESIIDERIVPSSYWANASSNSIVKSLIERADDITKKKLEALIEGKTIEKPIHEDITYDEGYEDIIKYGMSFYRKDCIIHKGTY